jgi:hypothetical protein
MQIPFQCTPGDYKEASAANGVWAMLPPQKSRAATIINQAGGAMIGISFAVVIFFSSGVTATWHVAPLALIASGLIAPAFIFITVIQLLLKLKRTALNPPPAGIVQAVVPHSIPGMSPAKAFTSMVIWIGVMGVLGAIHLVQRSTAAPTNADQPVRELPFVAVLGITFMPSVIAMTWLTVAARSLQIKSYVHGQPQLYAPKIFEFDETGVTIASDASQIKLRWQAIVKFVESEHLFVLYISEVFFHMVPKRALAAAGDVHEFVAALTTHVPRGVLLPRPPGGFPVQVVSVPQEWPTPQ